MKIEFNKQSICLFLNIKVEKQMENGPFIKGDISITIYEGKDNNYEIELQDGIEIEEIRIMGQTLTEQGCRKGNIYNFCESYKNMGINIQDIICNEFEEMVKKMGARVLANEFGIILP